MENEKFKNSEVDIKMLLSMTMADIDIFLIKNENQIEDKDKLFSKEEIRNQLAITLKKVISILQQTGVNVDEPLKMKVLDLDFSSNKK